VLLNFTDMPIQQWDTGVC